MSDPAMDAPWPAGQSYLEKLPTEIIEIICDTLGPERTRNYLMKTSSSRHPRYPNKPAEACYPSDPIDSQSYLKSRRALYNLARVSKRLSPVARKYLLRKVSVTDPQCLFKLAKSLALYPDTRPHVKWLGIDAQFISGCHFQEEDGGDADPDGDMPMRHPKLECLCDGEYCGVRPLYHRHWDTCRLSLEMDFMWNFEKVLKVPEMKGFPDMGHLLQLVRQMQYTEVNLDYFLDDRTFEQMCNIGLKVAIFLSPNLQALRLTADYSHSHSFLFRYSMGIVPAPTESFGPFAMEYHPDVAKFLTTLNMGASSFRHFSTAPTLTFIPTCPATLEELTLIDDGPIYVNDDQERCRGIEPHQLLTWLKPAKRLRKLRLYSGLDVEGLTMVLRWGLEASPYNLTHLHNINTILLAHRKTLLHFEWCQMSNPWKTDEQAWIKMFGPDQKLSCLAELKELTYLKLSDMFVYTRQQYLDRRASLAAMDAVTKKSILLKADREYNDLVVLRRNLLYELSAPPKLKRVIVVGNLPRHGRRYIEVNT
ncbi:hypothetical protein B0T09DRAFT_396324 [Sordaria sp. MPI-SDFR-AT-0083]|nr:hypothetical protein B0T09DRAFT_396324 [Sordaria sp. MPI-SDFR-AT-0083]